MFLKVWLAHTALLLLLFAQEVQACTCPPRTPDSLLETASRAFLGRVEEVAYLQRDRKRREPRIRVTFEVLKEWKGDPELVTFDTVYNKWSCEGCSFKEGRVYAVFAHRVEKELVIGLCGVLDAESLSEEELSALDSAAHEGRERPSRHEAKDSV